ncbi:hypothetical protein [Actinacidiphila acidipaludis]|uniref:Uncharacterized protein n=1 Tax=Actinacidiphila acidipaludis TaxID=2873382 RepID=A0ABS7Q5L3_9ACTN|nr:hypothetical protein [Streptomyces acidipaludis]MBY8877292.1 hypothetical protein [Streptomyces acidipaludis]
MMRIGKKLATAAVAGGILVGGVAVAAPASATVVNVSCPTNGVTVYSSGANGEADYCYVLRRDGSTGPGWANIPGTWAVGSGVNTGYVTDPTGWAPVHFSPGTMNLPACGSGCLWTTRWVYITS